MTMRNFYFTSHSTLEMTSQNFDVLLGSAGLSTSASTITHMRNLAKQAHRKLSICTIRFAEARKNSFHTALNEIPLTSSKPVPSWSLNTTLWLGKAAVAPILVESELTNLGKTTFKQFMHWSSCMKQSLNWHFGVQNTKGEKYDLIPQTRCDWAFMDTRPMQQGNERRAALPRVL